MSRFHKYIAPILSLFLATFAVSQMRRNQAPPSPTQTLNPDIAVTTPDPAFPLRVHLFDVRWGGLGYRNHGYGIGNLLEPESVQGFDFAFECDAPFQANVTPADTYQARWKKSPNQLEILTAEVGGKYTHICKLNLALETQPFSESNRVRFIHGVSASFRNPWTDPGFAYEGPAPDYPLHFHVVDGQRQEDANGNHGTGTANLTTPEPGSTVQGAEYKFDCERGFVTSSQLASYYPARWKKPQQTLELLLQRPGSNTVDHCIVTVALRPDAFPQAPGRTPRP